MSAESFTPINARAEFAELTKQLRDRKWSASTPEAMAFAIADLLDRAAARLWPDDATGPLLRVPGLLGAEFRRPRPEKGELHEHAVIARFGDPDLALAFFAMLAPRFGDEASIERERAVRRAGELVVAIMEESDAHADLSRPYAFRKTARTLLVSHVRELAALVGGPRRA